MTKYSTYLWWGALILIVLIFSSLRLPSIYYREVAYTYDQARDFLAGARMVTDHHLTFIGPTTGIGGLFHGVWWYYFTAFTFLISHNPITVYVAVFLVQLISLIVGMIVIRRLLGSPASLIFGMIVSTGSYFIRTSTFVGNNIMAMPSYLAYILSLSYLILSQPKGRNRLIAFAIFGLSVGFVAEFELAFGLFLLPITLLVCLLTPLRKLLSTKRSFIVYVLSVIFPFIPRILFEIKNHFIQIKVLLGFFTKPKYYTVEPFQEIWNKRISTYVGYLNDSFISPYIVAFFAFCVVIVILTWIINKKQFGKQRTLFLLATLLSLHLCLFILTFTYKDTFWSYYYEGIHYGILITGLVAVSILFGVNILKKLVWITVPIFIVYLLMYTPRAISSWNSRTTLSGLKVQEAVIDEIVAQEKGKNGGIFCAKVYVPAVIPYTYDYLWLYHYLKRTVETPRDTFQRGYCWYIIEPDAKEFAYRIAAWKLKNIPANAKIKPQETKIINGIEISKYYLE